MRNSELNPENFVRINQPNHPFKTGRLYQIRRPLEDAYEGILYFWGYDTSILVPAPAIEPLTSEERVKIRYILQHSDQYIGLYALGSTFRRWATGLLNLIRSNGYDPGLIWDWTTVEKLIADAGIPQTEKELNKIIKKLWKDNLYLLGRLNSLEAEYLHNMENKILKLKEGTK